MTERQQTQRQAPWKTLLIIGIVGSAVWLFSLGYNDNPFDIALRYAAGAAAGIGLFAGLIMLIVSRKD